MQEFTSCAHTSLPDISFVGGLSGDLAFNLKNPDGTPFDGSPYSAVFRIRPRRGAMLDFGAIAVLCEDADGTVSRLRVRFPPSETKDLDGEFIYQLTLASKTTGEVCEPMQGRMFIAPNVESTTIGGRRCG